MNNDCVSFTKLVSDSVDIDMGVTKWSGVGKVRQNRVRASDPDSQFHLGNLIFLSISLWPQGRAQIYGQKQW